MMVLQHMQQAVMQRAMLQPHRHVNSQVLASQIDKQLGHDQCLCPAGFSVSNIRVLLHPE